MIAARHTTTAVTEATDIHEIRRWLFHGFRSSSSKCRAKGGLRSSKIEAHNTAKKTYQIPSRSRSCRATSRHRRTPVSPSGIEEMRASNCLALRSDAEVIFNNVVYFLTLGAPVVPQSVPDLQTKRAPFPVLPRLDTLAAYARGGEGLIGHDAAHEHVRSPFGSHSHRRKSHGVSGGRRTALLEHLADDAQHVPARDRLCTGRWHSFEWWNETRAVWANLPRKLATFDAGAFSTLSEMFGQDLEACKFPAVQSVDGQKGVHVDAILRA